MQRMIQHARCAIWQLVHEIRRAPTQAEWKRYRAFCGEVADVMKGGKSDGDN